MIKEALSSGVIGPQSDRIQNHQTIAGDEIIAFPDGKYETIGLPKHGRDGLADNVRDVIRMGRTLHRVRHYRSVRQPTVHRRIG